jgi:hypothetical protein
MFTETCNSNSFTNLEKTECLETILTLCADSVVHKNPAQSFCFVLRDIFI